MLINIHVCKSNLNSNSAHITILSVAMNFNFCTFSSKWVLLFCATLVISILASIDAANIDRKVHVVYMGDKPKNVLLGEPLHKRLLEKVVGSGASELLIHSYRRSFNGFAAKLSDTEAKKFASMSQVVSVFPSKTRELHTTKSWNFIGFPETSKRATYESSIIIGMLDTGIWPESESFSDEGLGPAPSKWKGSCKGLSNFTCNNKIIGAKYYNSEGETADVNSPRDTEGHGSHTSSTAAGRAVSGMSLYDLAEGTGRGGVPSAKLAVYKICWSFGCADADILAAFDDAIADGVDIISLSVGGSFPNDYFEDSIAIGAFHAMKNGILTSNSAGNSGPSSYSVANYSPWSLTVAASTIDRRFAANVTLGNGKAYEGAVINTFNMSDKMYPLVYGGDAPNVSAGYDGSTSRYCDPGSLNTTKVKGTIVLCDATTDASGPLLSGAVGTVMQGDSTKISDYAFSFPLPATVLGEYDSANVSLYVNITSNPTASIQKGQAVADPAAPYVVTFSSRGPNPITADILKPDLTAPGVDILAAWSPAAPFSTYDGDTRSVSYNIISGTSMACPHASGAAAYVKSFNPDWSPAAIKSALMTTAYAMNSNSNADAEFAYGAGQINPTAAVKPGLIYEAGEQDYVSMLCGQGYSTKNLRLVTGDKSSCTADNNSTVWDLNYPSFSLSTKKGSEFSKSFKRTITNVGDATSLYKAIIASPPEVKVSIEPSSFQFKSLTEKQTFTLKVEGVIKSAVVSASLLLTDGVYHVRSPIVVYTT